MLMRQVTGRGVAAGQKALWHRPRRGACVGHAPGVVAPRTRRRSGSRLCGHEDGTGAGTDRGEQMDATDLGSSADLADTADALGTPDASPASREQGRSSSAEHDKLKAREGRRKKRRHRSMDGMGSDGEPLEQFRFSNLLAEMVQTFNDTAPKAPWKLDTVFTVIFMWILSFWIAAYKVVPSVLAFIKSAIFAPQGVTLSYSAEAALRHLLLDTSQMVVIAVLLQRALRSYAYREFFAIRPKQKSAKKNALSWIAIGFGVATFPAVDWLHKTMVTLFSGGGQFVRTASSVSMFDGDGVYTKLLWFLVLGVAAPVWEEAMFRGFLLPSLARVTSPAMAVVVTSLLFSLVHFTREGFLPLMILGTIFGISYCVTRGLFTSIVLHGLWNVCLLAQVMWRGGL